MKLLKKVFAMLLTLILCLGCLPTSAFAADATFEITWKIYVYDENTGIWSDPANPPFESRNFSGTTKGDSYTPDWTWTASGKTYIMKSEHVRTNTNASAYIKHPSKLWNYDTSQYEFLGWSKTGATLNPEYKVFTGDPNGSYDISTKTATYYYILKKKAVSTNYSLQYDANGGAGAPPMQLSSSTAASVSFTLSTIKPTRDGHTFLGWSTRAYATTADYQPGSKVTVYKTNPNLKLYAVWEKALPQTGSVTIVKVFKGLTEAEIPDNFAMYAQVTDDNGRNERIEYHAKDAVLTMDDGFPAYKWEGTTTTFGVQNAFVITEENAEVEGYDVSASNTTFYVGTNFIAGTRKVTNTYTRKPEPKKTFKVIYSNGSSTREYEIPIEREGQTFDLTQPSENGSYGVSEGYLYAGLYTDSTFDTPVDEDTELCGLTIMPETDDVYYVKEISDAYLRPKTLTVYDGNNVMKSVYMLTAIDSENYLAVGFVIDESFMNETTDVYRSITATQGQKTYLYETSSVFGVEGYQCILPIDPNDYTFGESFTALPYFVTHDHVQVTGVKERTVTFIENSAWPKTMDADVDSITTEYENGGDIISLMYLDIHDNFDGDKGEGAKQATITKNEEGEVTTQSVETGNCTGQITYTEKVGKCFAGWYMDADFTKPADFSNVSGNMTVYAKYVSDEFLKVKLQTFSTLKAITRIRTITAVDCQEYAEAGFDYVCGDDISSFSTDKYSSKLGTLTPSKLFGGEVTNSAKIVYNDYRCSSVLVGTTVKVTPYWVTLDGTKVNGTPRSVIYQGKTIEVVDEKGDK